MEDLKLLMKRVADEVRRLDVVLIRFIAIPSGDDGPDMIACSFEILPNAVKTSDEIQHERLEDDFFSILGDMTAEVDEEGNVIVDGGGDAVDEETEQDRQEREQLREERIRKIMEDLEDDG